MTPPAEAPELLCEMCHEPGLLAELPFRRARSRHVCVLCLALCIENVTGWRMVRQVRQYIQSAAEAPMMRAMARTMREQIERERQAVNG